jgi:hypothetical protein
MPDLTMSIPHQLTRDGVKQRIQEQIQQSQQHFGNMLTVVEERWEGYTLNLKVFGAGQTITGKAVVEQQVVNVTVALPWMLALLTGSVRQGIEQQARQLLQPPRKP